MIAASIDVAAGNLRFERRVLFDWPYGLTQSLNRRYDVAPDGQRFITVKSLDDDSRLPPQIVVVENWLEDVERRTGAGTETR